MAPNSAIGFKYMMIKSSVTTNTPLTTGSDQYKSIKLPENYYYSSYQRQVKEFVFGEKKNGN